ncbi:MAG TPA: oligosaccharide flippase family protein [Candidatus Baltobacteraceae bacterium]|nr:oligosaccharide flippase family protein [Candidatus Baltobacteraceae bacterium]
MSDIGKKSLQTLLRNVLIQGAGIIGSIVIARSLGPGGKGIYTYAVVALGAIVIPNGLASAIAWQYTKRHRSPAAILRAMMTILAAVAVPLSIVLAAIGLLVPSQRALLYVAAATPVALFAQSASGFFLADSDVRTINASQTFSVLAVAVYVPLLIFAHASVWTVLAVWVAGSIASAVYVVVKLRRYAAMTTGDDDGPIVREQLKFGAQMGITSLSAYLNFRIDVFIIIFMLGQTALGLYSVGLGIAELLWQLNRSIVTASFGRIARGEEDTAAVTTATSMRHAFTVVTVSAILVALLAPPIVPRVYGSAFEQSVLVTLLLLPGIVAYSMMGLLSTFFTQQIGEPRLPLIFRLISTIICAVATILLLPRIGIIGGAIATSISYVISFALAAGYFVRRTGTAPSNLFFLRKSDLESYRSLLRVTLNSLRRIPT